MEIKEYEIEVVTPMFLAGADQQKAEIRAASIKGQLRWWWRAMNGHLNLEELKKQEEEIFGSTKKMSSFILQVEPIKIKINNKELPKGRFVKVEGKSYKASIIHYLAFGPIDKGRLKRPYIEPGSKFKLIILFHSELPNSFIKAFILWIKYGGIGAKTRNGFGSIACLHKFNNDNEIILAEKRQKYTALSKETLLFKFNTHNNWEDALSEIGIAYREARLKLEPRHIYTKRVLVGMPIIQDKNTPNKNRHSKPLLMHVDKFGSNFEGKILLMPQNYYDPVFGENKNREYGEVIKKLSADLQKKAKEVTNVI